jgi:hypothetical protein
MQVRQNGMTLRVEVSNPWHKNKNVPRMGHPKFLAKDSASEVIMTR